MFAVGYAWNELRRRWSRTVVTAIGLAAGVGLVMGIVGVSNGLTHAQNKVLSPLSSVGTDIIVTRTVAATSTSTSGSTTTTTTTRRGRVRWRRGLRRRWRWRWRRVLRPGAGGGRGGASAIPALNSSDQAALLNANSSVLTDLSKLGPARDPVHLRLLRARHAHHLPERGRVRRGAVKGVASAVPGLSLQALHETGTVPSQTDTVTTGGQTITSSSARRR